MCHALNVWFPTLLHSSFRWYPFHIPNTRMLMFPHYRIYLSYRIHVPIVTSFQEYFIHIRNVHVNNSILFTLSMLSFSHFWVFCISVQCKDCRKVEWLGDKWNKTEEKIIPIISHVCVNDTLTSQFPTLLRSNFRSYPFHIPNTKFLNLPVSCSQSVLFSFFTISLSFQIKCRAVWLYG